MVGPRFEHFYDDLPQWERDRIFTIGATGACMSNVFFGPYLDKFGGARCGRLAGALMCLGAVGMAVAELDAVHEVGGRPSLLILSFGLLGLGGPGMQLPTLRCEHLFPENGTLVTSVNIALFDASCAVLLCFKLSHAWLPAMSVQRLFEGYAIVLFMCLASGQVLFGYSDRAYASRSSVPEGQQDVVTAIDAPVQKFSAMVFSFRFVYLATFCAIGILRLNFVVMTLNAQLADAFGPESRETHVLSYLFSTLVPLGGLIAPLTAILLSRFRRWAYRVCLMLGVAYGICIAIPDPRFQVLAYVIISFSRQLTFTIVFVLSSSLFGHEHLGKLLAANDLLRTVVGLLQYPIARAKGSVLLPNWFAVDMFMVALTVPLFCSNGDL